MNATRQTGEPAHGGTGGSASIWYRWTAPANGTLAVTTQGSSFDTLLGVYTGTDVADLRVLGQNDDTGSGQLWSTVTTTVAGGTTYAIAIDGWGGAKGSTALTHTFTASPTLTNDTIAYSQSNHFAGGGALFGKHNGCLGELYVNQATAVTLATDGPRPQHYLVKTEDGWEVRLSAQSDLPATCWTVSLTQHAAAISEHWFYTWRP